MRKKAKTATIETTFPGTTPFRLTFLFVLFFAGALLLRALFLTEKPPHFDEGINGWFVMQMWKQGFYKYDPTNFHGPLYFYILQYAELLMGRGIFSMRFVTALLSIAILWIILLHKRFFGRVAVTAAIVMAVSPAMVFYGRYAIHESLFVLCQVLFSYGYFSWKERPTRRAYLAMAVGIAGSFATKETFFIFLGTWFISLFCLNVADKLRPSIPEFAESKSSPPAQLVLTVDTLLVGFVVLTFFSGFFMNLQGINDMMAAFVKWTQTGVGHKSGHEKPFFYWIDLLRHYEWPALLGLVGFLGFFFSARKWERHFYLLSFGLFLAYSLIPYKTPWLIMGMVWPMAFAFGFVREHLTTFKLSAVRVFGALSLGLALMHSVFRTIDLNFYKYVDHDEPYVYVQSNPDLNEVMNIIRERIKKYPEDLNMRVIVTTRDPWPFPWLMGGFPAHEFNAESSNYKEAEVVFADQSRSAEIEAKLSKAYWRRPMNLRGAYESGYAYFSMDKFADVKPELAELVPAKAGGR